MMSNFSVRVMHFSVCPSGLNDFTTQWLLEFLILAAWSSDFLFNFNVLIMLQALLKSAGVFRPLGLNFSIGCFCCGAGAKTKATNASNERIADKTNALNYKMWQEQKQYDYENGKRNLPTTLLLLNVSVSRKLALTLIWLLPR